MVTSPIRGRQAEVEQLRHAIRATAAGAGGVILLEGPAGIGKTALLGSARELAATSGFVVCAGDCDELDQMTPLAPLLTAMRSSGPALLDRRTEGALRTTAEPLHAVEALGAILERASARRPILVAVDDVQWADHTTVMALSILSSRLFATAVLWLLTRRPNPSTPQVQTLTDRVNRAGGAIIPIGPLSTEAALTLASDIVGARPDRQLSALISQAAGNPFYVVELLNGLQQSNALQVQDGLTGLTSHDIPEGFRSAIASHTRPLGEPTKRLLDVGSVLGRQFSAGDAAALMDEPVGRLLGSIEEARRAHLLVDTGDSLAFRHDLLRQAIYDQLPGSVRQALHQEAASVLEARNAPSTAIAYHVAISGVPGDERAIKMLERASRELIRPNPGAAADLACRALDLRPPDDPGRPAAAARAVGILGAAGRPDQAIPLAQQTLASGPLDATVEASLLASIRLSNLLNCGRTTDLPPLPPRLLADPTLKPSVARALKLFDAFGRRFEDFERAEDVWESVGGEAEAAADEMMVARIRKGRYCFLSGRGELDSALRALEEAVALAERGSPEVKETVPRIELSLVLYSLDRLEDALVALGQASSDAQLYNRSLMAQTEAARALVLLAAGRLDEALVEADSATTEAEDARLPHPPPGILRVQAEIALRRGDADTARAAAKWMASLAAAHPIYPDDLWVIALVAGAEGRFDEALTTMKEPLAALGAGHYFIGVPHHEDLSKLVSMALRAGERTSAEMVTTAAITLADRNRDVPTIAGTAAHALGLLERSEPHLRQAVELLTAGPRPLAAAAAMEDLADTLERLGERDEAIGLRQTANDIYSRVGATHDAARVQSGLHRLGVHRPQRSPQLRQGWESLSPAELSVVHVVAEGVTSQVASERLYVSVNTVNTHLRHAFAKLGVRSRAELTRVVLAHDPPSRTRGDRRDR